MIAGVVAAWALWRTIRTPRRDARLVPAVIEHQSTIGDMNGRTRNYRLRIRNDGSGMVRRIAAEVTYTGSDGTKRGDYQEHNSLLPNEAAEYPLFVRFKGDEFDRLRWTRRADVWFQDGRRTWWHVNEAGKVRRRKPPENYLETEQPGAS